MGQRTHLHTQLLAMLDQPHAGARLAERLQGESHVVSLLHARLGAQQEGLGSSAGLAGGTSRQLLAQQKFAATGVNSQVVAGLGGCSKADQLRLLVQTAIAEGNGGLGEQLAGMWRGAAGRSAILAASERRNQLEGGIQGRAGPAATAAAHRQTAVAVAQQRGTALPAAGARSNCWRLPHPEIRSPQCRAPRRPSQCWRDLLPGRVYRGSSL